jgi:hypothetical protein
MAGLPAARLRDQELVDGRIGSAIRRSVLFARDEGRVMKQVAKRVMRSWPAVFNPLWSLTYPWIIRRDEKYFGHEYDDRAEAFRTIYEQNRWASAESRSGNGSTLAYTADLRKALAQSVARLNVGRLLDAPCGDFN